MYLLKTKLKTILITNNLTLISKLKRKVNKVESSNGQDST